MAAKNDIEIRSMTMLEYDAFQDYVDELEKENYTDEKKARKIAMYVCEKIAGMNLNDKSATIAKVMKVYDDIINATKEENEKQEKN